MRILIVAWAWPPIGRVGAMRPLGLSREWRASGHEVHVLTGPGDRGGEYTPDLQPLAALSGAEVARAPAPGIPRPAELTPAFADPSGVRTVRPISRLRQIAGQWRGFPDAQRSWIRPATARARDLIREVHPDVVWSTSPPESVHCVGRALAAEGLPWVADFRDQWSEYLLARWDPLSRRLIDRISRRVLGPAAAITAATEGVARSLERATHRDVICVRNGFDPPPASDQPVARRTLGYFGRVDPLSQHPERLWPALRRLRDAGRGWRLEFHASPGGGGGAEVSVPPDLRDLVSVQRPLPHPEALRKMQSMTALLVLAWETRGGETSVAAKLYEYVGSARPVLVCAPRGWEARELVESTGTGVGAWEPEELAVALDRLEAFEASASGRSSLARSRSAEQLLDVFEAAVKRSRQSRAAG